ncbi:7313_t:CDS:2, partial [Entrophospora sp. SA101]
AQLSNLSVFSIAPDLLFPCVKACAKKVADFLSIFVPERSRYVKVQLYDECKNLQTKITPYLSSVIEKNLLEKLLILNDNLSTTLQKYDEMYNKHKGKSITVTLSKEPKVPEAPSDSNTSSNDQVESADSNNSSTISHTIPISTPISQTTLLPKTTSSTEPFSIIDSEDDE